MKRRNAALVMLLALVLECLPWAVCPEVPQTDGTLVRQYFSSLDPEPVALGLVTPPTTVFLTCVLLTLSLIYWKTMHRGSSLAMLILDVIAAVAVLGTLLAGTTVISCAVMLLLTVHFLLIRQARQV